MEASAMIGTSAPRIVLTLTTVAALAAGCTGTTAGGGQATGPKPSTIPSSTPATVGTVAVEPVDAPKSPATSSSSAWSTAPVTVVHNPAVPPVPVVTGVRYAAHPKEGFDRIVFDIPGALPGYSAKYVSQVVADGSGKPVSVPGSHYLLIVFTPAQAHRDNGTATISGTHRVNLPMIESYAVVGDYEGYVSVALGLNGKAGYHIAELSGRVYIDVKA
jgi:hypothetical protein